MQFSKSNKLANVCYDIRGPVLKHAKRLEEEGQRILKLNIGNPAPFGFEAPDEILQDVIRNLPTAQGYSDSKGLFSARKAVMQYYQQKQVEGVGIEDIYLGNGVSELIVMSLQALLNNGDEVLVPAPDYPLWTAAVSLAGGNAVHYLCDEGADWFPDLADIKAKFGDQVRIGPYLGTYYYAFKTDKAPWDNVKLRHAVSMAIDRDYLAEKVWQNTMIPAYSFVPPGITGYATRATDYAEKSQLDREDEAKKVLTELGYGPDKPLKMEIRFNTSENHKNTAVAIQEQLKPLGIEVSLVNTDTKTHYGLLEQHGDFDIARAGWIADYKDPENFLALCKTGTGNNYAAYTNKEYDDLMAAAASAATPEERMKLLSDAEAIGVARDLCVVPLLYYSYHDLVSSKLKGWEDNVMDVHPTRFLAKE